MIFVGLARQLLVRTTTTLRICNSSFTSTAVYLQANLSTPGGAFCSCFRSEGPRALVLVWRAPQNSQRPAQLTAHRPISGPRVVLASSEPVARVEVRPSGWVYKSSNVYPTKHLLSNMGRCSPSKVMSLHEIQKTLHSCIGSFLTSRVGISFLNLIVHRVWPMGASKIPKSCTQKHT